MIFLGDVFSNDSKLRIRCVMESLTLHIKSVYVQPSSISKTQHYQRKTHTLKPTMSFGKGMPSKCLYRTVSLPHARVDLFAGSMGSGGNNYTRRDGFNDNEPRVESYGSGPGSGAYDLANTGLGG